MTEYDMDEQDRYWLSAFNAERKEKEGEPEVPESFFESVMDKLDKEWFNLVGFDFVLQIPLCNVKD